MDNITYRYERPAGGYPVPGALAQGLSRHHMFSYPFMLTYAVVVLHYLALNRNEKALGKLDKFYRDRGIGGIPFHIGNFRNNALEVSVNANMGSLVWICWAEPNLFIGPSGVLRDDDPSQRREPFPLSLPARQKLLAEAVAKKWAAMSSSRIVGKEGDEISVAFDERKLPEFADCFLDYIGYVGKGGAQSIHRTTFGDWVVVDNEAKPGKVFQFVMKIGNNEADQQERFYFRLREDGMEPDKRGVSVAAFDDKSVLGKYRGAITEEELKTVF